MNQDKKKLKRIESDFEPVTIRLGELKPLLRERANTEDRSMHSLILKFVMQGLGVEKKKKYA